MNRFTTLALLTLTCSACATTTYRPVVDTGVSRGDYEADLVDCQALADQRPAGNAAGAGAAIGGIFAAALGAAVGLRGNDVARLAAWGATNGAVRGGIAGAGQQQAIVANCMTGRGYAVVAP